MTFAIVTLGCKANQYEGQRMREALSAQGWREQPFGSRVGLSIINTCTVTHQADVENRKLIRKALGQGRVIVSGCQAVTDPDAIFAIDPSIEVMTPAQVAEAFASPLPRFISAFAGHARAFVKVQDGCDHFCAYCIVPRARGCPVSRPANDIVDEINTLVRSGYREAVLTGINIGLYEGGLAALIGKILNDTAIARVRISSIEPWTFDPLLFEVLESPRVCRHLHLPLQSGNAKVLEAMGRPYTPQYYEALIRELKTRFPDLGLGSDVMVGFPGEDEADFEESRRFISGLPLAYLHVFAYSRREGTKASALSHQVPSPVKRRRALELKRLSDEKRAAFEASQQGRHHDILVTTAAGGVCHGISGNYLPVRVACPGVRGELLPVRIDGVQAAPFRGRIHG
ncbi:MAG: MiaB/RimO family radical SAM methylthiotransferase [Syntrophaceae bacterium]